MAKRLLALLLLLLILITLYHGFANIFTLDMLKDYAQSLQNVVSKQYVTSAIVYILVYIAAITLCLPTSALLTTVGGFLFGLFFGALFALIGATIGSIGAFLLIRHFFGAWLQHRYAHALRTINNNIDQYGYNYLLAVRFISIFPSFLINILAGLSNVSLSMFATTTAVGLLPSVLMYAFAGEQLCFATTCTNIFSWKIILLFMLLALFVLLPIIAPKILPKRFFDK